MPEQMLFYGLTLHAISRPNQDCFAKEKSSPCVILIGSSDVSFHVHRHIALFQLF